MGARPSGTVTFLFTDIEGSTRLWENDAGAMRVALAAHDAVLVSAVEGSAGWVFKHTGDGVCAAFSSAAEAVAAAVEAQRWLGLAVRMGIATGSAELRGEDYFGPVLNRAARVMAAGHGGQILMAAATAGLVGDEAVLVDLGEHSLRDLAGVHRIFQVRAEGLRVEFPPLRTLDAVPGNLPVPSTSFVGRAAAVEELMAAVRAHRLVTLTGVGGVGKTRLAVRVAAELVPAFPDGVWLVELAPVGDPAAVPDAVATVLGVTSQASWSVTDSIAEALSGRRLLLILDNCEHVVDAVAGLIDTILARTATVKILATSREGLRLGAERLWPVPSLAVDGGVASEAIELFVDRARAVNPAFSLADEADAEAVAVICRRLDGIALAIELAAARMVAMSPLDVRDRLDDRFRLLTGGRRGVERHQTLRHAVAWSYDLLTDHERMVLVHGAVFAGGFDLAAATHICEPHDEYAVLDVLDSLVRKSLVTVAQHDGHARYGMLETIRQFAEEHLAPTGTVVEVRDRHARYFAAQAVAYWDLWDGPRMRVALDWVDVEFANLRAGFRWAADHHDLVTAVAIAAHTTILAYVLQRFEPVGWAEELLDVATAAQVPQLPRLYTAASYCVYTGSPDAAVAYAQTAVSLEADPAYHGFQSGLSSVVELVAHLYAGRIERALELCAELVAQHGLARAIGLSMSMWLLPVAGRGADARRMADEALAFVRAYGEPASIAWTLGGHGRAFAETDPPRALTAFREGIEITRQYRLLMPESALTREAARLEALNGDLLDGLVLFDTAIDAFHRAGNQPSLAMTLGSLAIVFDRIEQPETAAMIYGAGTRSRSIEAVPSLPVVVEHLRVALGGAVFADRVAAGAALEVSEAVAYARDQIRRTRHQRNSK